MTSFL